MKCTNNINIIPVFILIDPYIIVVFKILQENEQLDPEFSEFLDVLKTQKQVGFTGKEISQDEFIFDPWCNDRHDLVDRKTQSILMKGAQFDLEGQRLIYQQFFNQAFPYLFLTYQKFEHIMVKFGWATNQMNDLFRAFRSKPTNKDQGTKAQIT